MPMRVLVYAMSPDDSAVAARVVARSQLEALAVTSAPQLGDELAAGAGALLVMEEALAGPVLTVVTGYLAAQPDQPSDPVPLAVRQAVFAIPKEGDVHPSPVAAGGRQHVVRLISVRAARQRSLAEVDALIRVRLIEARQVAARQELLGRLRASTPIQVEQAALDRVEPPSPAAGASPAEPR